MLLLYSIKEPKSYPFSAIINGHEINEILIVCHYLEKHSNYMNDDLIIDLAMTLHRRDFPVDSASNGIEYFAADIEYGMPPKVYRLIWLFEGELLEIIGIVNAYRRKKLIKSEVKNAKKKK